MMRKERRVYTAEFKREAIRLAETSGKSIGALEKELGLGDSVLRKWIDKAKADGADAFPGHGRRKPADEARRRMAHEKEILRQEREIRSKSAGLQPGTEAKFAFIDRERGNYPLKRLCSVLKVSGSGYFVWRHRTTVNAKEGLESG